MQTRIIDLFLIDIDAEPDEAWSPEKYLRTRLELCFRLEDDRVFQQTINCEKQDALIYLNRVLHFFAVGRLHYDESSKSLIVDKPQKPAEWIQHKRLMQTFKQRDDDPFS